MGDWKPVARWILLPFLFAACTTTGPPESTEESAEAALTTDASQLRELSTPPVSPYEDRLLSLEKQRDQLKALEGLKGLEFSLVEDIAFHRASVNRLQRRIDDAEGFLYQITGRELPPTDVPAVEEVPRTVLEHRNWSDPAELTPGAGEILMARISLKSGEEQILRYIKESESSILVGLPNGVISIPRSTVSRIEPFLMEADEYHFALGDYFDNIPTSGNFYEAMRHYRITLDINPEHADAKEKLGRCEEQLPKILEWEKTREEARASQRERELREMEMQALAENQARVRWETELRNSQIVSLQRHVSNLRAEVGRLRTTTQYQPYYYPYYGFYRVPFFSVVFGTHGRSRGSLDRNNFLRQRADARRNKDAIRM